MRFKDLDVWQLSIALVADIYRLTAKFPVTERFGLTSQIRRAMVSIPANIAEGHGRETRGEFINQLSVARGSANEVETLLHVSMILGFPDPGDMEEALSKLNRVQAMIVHMRRGLRASRNQKPSTRSKS